MVTGSDVKAGTGGQDMQQITKKRSCLYVTSCNFEILKKDEIFE